MPVKRHSSSAHACELGAVSLSRRGAVAATLASPLVLAAGGQHTLVGAYTGNELADADAFARWLGRPADLHLVYFNQQGWEPFASSIPWIAERHAGRRNLWSVPLSATHGGFVEVAGGHWNGLFAGTAAAILRHAPPGTIDVRIGWEMNLPDQEQSAFRADGQPDPATWVAAYRRVATMFRAASPRFRLSWCPNVGADHLDPELCWPGGDLVDCVGVDLYFNDRWDRISDRGASVWTYRKTSAGGLDWLVSHARRTRKRLCLPEWGINNDQATAFADALIAWIGAHNLLYHGYWDSDAAINSRLSAERLPEIGRRYRAAFA